MMRAMLWITCLLGLNALAAIKDVPFRQDVAVRYTLAPDLQGAAFLRLEVDKEGVVYVLTDRGVARAFDDRVSLDHSFRPLNGKLARDIGVYRGSLYYLFEDGLLSNGFAGKDHLKLPTGAYRRFCIGEGGAVFLAGETNLAPVNNGVPAPIPFVVERTGERLYAWGSAVYILTPRAVYKWAGNRLELFLKGQDLTCLAFRGTTMFVGSKQGFLSVDATSGRVLLPLQTRLPATDITCLAALQDGLWVGTTQGAFFAAGTNQMRYYASRRWLEDDQVVDLRASRTGDALILTRAGLSKIELRPMTLLQKAAYYERKIRQRHMRYGFCSELRLTTPGDITTAEMIDTDNDGTWSSYYLASQAFRFAVTGEEDARLNAWETFDTLERLQGIHNVEGFPARTFERRGFKVSDPDRWHVAPDPTWEWKAHTSSDEITAHTFAYAVLYETATRTAAEKARIAGVYLRIIDHLLKNRLYLVDVDGQPTLWGRWNPEYVNQYPPTVVDRRLNSAEMVAFLQFAYRLSGNERYRQEAMQLMEQHGYLQNIMNTMAKIAPTTGAVFRGNDMGNEWNHSDDLLGFVNYWTLYRYAFNDDLRRRFAMTIRDHWELERGERNPLWNFIYALTGAPQYDLEAAIWTLQRYPLDMINWSVKNSGRKDLTPLAANFRNQPVVELLPPGERPTSRWNGNPFTLDGGDGGTSELAGDEFLLPYWMGRYLRIIQ